MPASESIYWKMAKDAHDFSGEPGGNRGMPVAAVLMDIIDAVFGDDDGSETENDGSGADPDTDGDDEDTGFWDPDGSCPPGSLC